MSIRIGVNGFGRIGRYLLRLLANDPEFTVVAINARADNASLAHLFKYDSTHQTYKGTVEHNGNGIIVDGKLVRVTAKNTNEWDWATLGCDIVVETTGSISDKAGLEKHIACGAKKVVLSAPGKNVDLTIVMGVNDNLYDTTKHAIVSNASCTTNCLAPVAMVLNDQFGIRHGFMTTVHSYTMDQRILDGSHKDLRRGRAAAVSMVPTTTGAAKALSLVIPALTGKMDGQSIRVPTPNVSLIDLTCDLEKDVTVESINAALKTASQTSLKNILGYSDEPLVSCDYLGSTYGGVVDSLCTQVIGTGRMAKVIAWYDNESGFTCQLVRLLRMIGKKL